MTATDAGPELPVANPRSMLELLASGASAQQLAAASPDDAQRQLALQIHTEFSQAVRREKELEALLDIATDLSAFDDPGSVLDTIVRRARSLLGTDLTYLTLFDQQAGDTYMRATAGSVSARFQTVRLEAGAGLGGLAATTRHPYWTADYWNDERFRHTANIDSAVHDEGIIAICGVPLLVRDEFVGVLFAANRSHRPFSRDEVSLLTALATLAAVTIVQVQARDQAATALHELSRAHDVVQRQAAGVERAAAAHDRFADLVLHGGGVDDITAALTELLGGWVAHVDTDGRVQHSSGRVPREARLRDAVGAAKPDDRLQQVGETWVVSVQAADRDLGALVLGELGDLDSADRRTIERAAVVTSLVLLIQLNRAEAQQQLRTDLVADLLGGHADPADLTKVAHAQGIDLDRPTVVLVGIPASTATRNSMTMAANSAIDHAAIVGEHSGRVVAVVNGDDPALLARRFADRMTRHFKLTVGGAGPITGAAAVPGAYDEASRAADALLSLGRPGEGAAVADLGFAGLVVAKEPAIGDFVRGSLGALTDYDAARGTELVKTLQHYFAAGQSPRHTATTLHVHVNTVTQRLDRIGQLLGSDWQRPDQSLELQLALRLRQLIGN